MRERYAMWLTAFVVVFVWLLVASDIMSGRPAQASGQVQAAWAVGLVVLVFMTGRVALLASEVAKLEHDRSATTERARNTCRDGGSDV